MNWLKKLLNRWTGAADEIHELRRRIDYAGKSRMVEISEKVNVAARHTFEAYVLDALRAPDRWQPDDPLTKLDVEAWAALLRSPLLVKIDLAMINMAQQEAQRAIHAEPADTIRAAGYAAGYRAAWQIAKALSTLPGAPTGKPENESDTAEPTLEHLNP